MGLLISPEVLMLVGNAAGQAGYRLGCFIVAAGLMHMIGATAYGKAYARYPNVFGEIRLIRRAFGAVTALCVPLCARVTVAVCVSTALLATAGYVFNEVFLYWFPNLGFSYCLLGVLVLINIFGTRASSVAQLVLVCVAVGGLILFIIAGLLELGNSPLPIQDGPALWSHSTQIYVAALLVFVGFDLAGFSRNHGGNPVKAMMIAIFMAGLIFIFWGWISTKYVILGRLTDTHIPHMIVARAAFGQSGRIWMGIIILAGASAAVNALLLAVPKMLAVMAKDGLLPSFLARGKNPTNTGVLLLGASVAAMMGAGMAGEPILEVYMKAGMCLWLLHYAVILGAAVMPAMRDSPGVLGQTIKVREVLFIVGLAAMVSAIGGMFLSAAHWKPLVKAIGTILAIGLTFGAFWVPFNKKKGRLPGL